MNPLLVISCNTFNSTKSEPPIEDDDDQCWSRECMLSGMYDAMLCSMIYFDNDETQASNVRNVIMFTGIALFGQFRLCLRGNDRLTL